MDTGAQSVSIRKVSGGQIFTGLKKELKNKEDLSIFYTPGIAQPCREIAQNPELAKELTIKKNTIAVISDGSAVLGLGNIGPMAGLPVMEGKCMLLKQFGEVDAIPLVLDTQDTEEIIQTIKNIAPTLGGINLEDIAAPRCFEIEERLSEMLDIPVFHDDQHGTAICVLAATINALKLTNRKVETTQIVIAGAGAAGIAIAKLFKAYGINCITLVDSKGIVCCDREDLHTSKQAFCTNQSGDLSRALEGADIFIGVSKPNTLTPEMIQKMNKEPIIFAMSNPDPEILPDLAKKAGAKIIATGRSDFPNQINNVLVFPGFFRGLLDAKISKITTQMKLEAAKALANLVGDKLSEDYIISSPFEANVAQTIAQAVKNT